MGWASERKAIETRLSTNWTTTPIKFHGTPFAETRNPYIALHIIPGGRSQITLGANPTVRSVSLIDMQIFVPADTGTRLLSTYADQLAPIFERAQFLTEDGNLISCQVADTDQDVLVQDGWAQFNVTIPYTRDEN